MEWSILGEEGVFVYLHRQRTPCAHPGPWQRHSCNRVEQTGYTQDTRRFSRSDSQQT